MTIIPMRSEHVRAVAALHARELTGLLRVLGAPAARAFYTGCLQTQHMIAFVAVDGAVVSGFVAGSMKPRALKLEAIARNPIAFTAAAAWGMLLRPSGIPFVWEMLRGASGPHDVGTPELTYLAVSSDQRRSGVGRQLVDVFTGAIRGAGAPAYDLSVDGSNIAADAFYRKLGFKNIGHYREFGAEHKRYRLDLPGSAK